MNYVSFATRACTVALCVAGFGTAARAGATFATFDPPGSIGTFPDSVNDSGSVAGWYEDGSHIHGFLRTSDGTIKSIDISGATYIFAYSINAGGAIVGAYLPGTNYNGFLRAADGTITTFEIGSGETVPTGINDTGTITGYCSLGGFVLKADGTVHTFNVSGAIGTDPSAINNKSAIAGYYYKHYNAYHSFIRATDGTITTFDPSGAKSSTATSINGKGAIVGTYEDTSKTHHGFLRQPDGSIMSIDIAGATWTEVSAIDDKGRITGYYAIPPNSTVNGFVMNASGKITSFSVPGRRMHTYPSAIARTTGIITGSYFQGSYRNQIYHGFVRTP